MIKIRSVLLFLTVALLQEVFAAPREKAMAPSVRPLPAPTEARADMARYSLGGKGSELIDTQALTHLACLWYSVNHEEDKDNRALLVLSSDEPAGTSGGFSR